MAKFTFYSTEISPTTTPIIELTPPTTYVVLDRDPIPEVGGQYDPQAGDIGRGAAFQTLGGIYTQDFDMQVSDNRIVMSDKDILSQSTVNSLKTMSVSGEWFFTDGYEVWKVKFSNPNGFKYRRNLALANSAFTRYSYEINLIPKEHYSGEI